MCNILHHTPTAENLSIINENSQTSYITVEFNLHIQQ